MGRGGLHMDGWFPLVGLRVNVFLFVWIARGRLISFRWIARGRLALSLRYSARMPLRILFFMLFISVAFIFSMDSDEGIQKNGIFVPSL